MQALLPPMFRTILRLLVPAIISAGVVLLLASNSSRLELIHADVSRGVVENGISLKILQGNVHARQDTLELFCDEAVYTEREKKIRLVGNVHILRGKEELTATEVTYYEESRLAIARGNVHLRRPGQELFTEYLEYYYETDQALAKQNLLLHDAEQQVYVTAATGEYLPDRNMAYVKHRAHLWRIDSTATDTLHIFSHLMQYFFKPQKMAIARDSVRILQGGMQAVCDSALYLVEGEKAYLRVSPKAVQENNEIVGKQMELIFQNMEVKQIVVRGDARASSVVDSLSGRENRLQGKKIIMFIENRKLRELKAISNASSIYYLREEGKDQGVNTATADTIRVFFTDGELDSISVKGGAQGVYYPANYKKPIKLEF